MATVSFVAIEYVVLGYCVIVVGELVVPRNDFVTEDIVAEGDMIVGSDDVGGTDSVVESNADVPVDVAVRIRNVVPGEVVMIPAKVVISDGV